MSKLAVVEPRTPEQILAEHLTSWEAHVSAWIDTREDTTKRQFVLGLIASSIATQYGEKSLAKFASEVNEAPSTIYLYRSVYQQCHQFSTRVENLNWSHFALIVKQNIPETKREKLLNKAAELGWSVRQLKREASIEQEQERKQKSFPHFDTQMAAAISHWKELKPQVEKFAECNPQFLQYASDFIEAVDEIIEEPWDSARAFVERLIHGGTREVEALAKATRWSKATIERFCEELIAYGSHEWREQGGKTEDARGARRKLIVPIEEPSGEMYGTRYGMVIGDDDDD